MPFNFISKTSISCGLKLLQFLLDPLRSWQSFAYSQTIMPATSKIVKSKSDTKEYRLICLENGLRALLISDLKGVDPESCVGESSKVDPPHNGNDLSDSFESDEYGSDYDSNCSDEELSDDELDESDIKSRPKRKKKQAAAALCIHVGSFSDPKEIPGLAHFLEHMVFMGSEKYPNENKFDAFISRHGGSDNAHTDCERTVFQFEIQPEYFADALHIWAQFFISPLMKYDSIKREVKAVDSEFNMSLNSDHCRMEQLLGHLVFPKNHPMGKFMWGNKMSLYDRPAKKGIDVYGALKKFQKKYYLANFMTLAVQSPEELDTLEEWVRKIFTEIPHKKEELPALPLVKPEIVPFQVVKVIPVKNILELSLVWILPPQFEFYRTKPLHYISWLIGHEGKGSILSLLKDKKLAFSLSGGNAGSGFEDNKISSTFSIVVALTEKGHSQYCEVIDIIFQYLNMLQKEGASERIFREIQKVEDIDFMFIEEEPPMENVVDLCENVLLFPEEDILAGDDLLFEFDPVCINNALEALKRDKCAFFLNSSSYKGMKMPKKESWFGTRYNIESLPDEWTKRWSSDFEDKAIDENLHLPSPNKFIAENFELKYTDDVEAGSSVDNTKFPRLVSGPDASYKLWFRYDDIFKLPKVYMRIHMLNPMSIQSPHNILNLELLVHLLVHNLAEVAYDADAASLTYSAEVGESGGLILKFSGYNDKLPLLVDTVAQYLVDFKTTEQDFDQRLVQHRRGYYNSLIKPGKLTKMLRLSILKKFGWSSIDKYNACQDLKYEEFLKFVQDFLSSLFVESLVQGNCTVNEANSMLSGFIDKLNCKINSEENLIQQRVLRLEGPPKICKVSGLNRSDENSMVTVYFQHGPYTVKECSLLRLLEAIMEEPCFDILRTKQQLGYAVYVQHFITAGILGLSVNVQTQRSKFSVEEIMNRVNDFVTKKMAQIVRKMPAQEFDAHLKSLIAVLRNDDTHLGEEVGRNWGEIVTRRYVFDRTWREIAYLETCTQAEFKNFYTTLCSRNEKVLHLQVQGHTGQDMMSPPQNGTAPNERTSVKPPPMRLKFLQCADSSFPYISNIEGLKDSSSYFPVSGHLDQ